MKKSFWRSFAASTVAVFAAFLGFTAKAALVAEWDGDFSELTKNGLTIAVGDGNSVAEDNSSISIGSASSTPIKITGLSWDNINVIVGITSASDAVGTVVEAYQSSGACGTYLYVNDGTMTGGWNYGTTTHNDTWSTSNSMPFTGSYDAAARNYVGMAYGTVNGSSTQGSRFYVNGKAVCDRKSGLVSTGKQISLVSIGGNPNRTGSSTQTHMLRGAVVSYIAIYNTVLSADENETAYAERLYTDGTYTPFEDGAWQPNRLGVDYKWVFTGEMGNHDWNTVGNWRENTKYYVTATGKTPQCTATYAPGTSDNSVSGLLFDGDVIGDNITANEDGYKVVTSSLVQSQTSGESVEGWAMQMVVTNHVDLQIGCLVKQQSTSTIIVDETSKITIKKAATGGDYGTHTIRVASENGITYESEYAPNQAGTYNYHLGAKGSVLFAGMAGSGGTHAIKSVTLELGDNTQLGKQILSRKLIGFTSTTHTFSAGSSAEVTLVNDAGGTIEGELSPAALTTADSIGEYYFHQGEDGYYVDYVAYAEASNIFEATVGTDTAWANITWTMDGETYTWATIPDADDAVLELTLADGAKVTLPAARLSFAALEVGGTGSLVFAEQTFLNGTVNAQSGAAVAFDVSSFLRDVASYAVDGLPSVHPLVKMTGAGLTGVTIDTGDVTLSNAYTLDATALTGFTVTADEGIVGQAISFNIDACAGDNRDGAALRLLTTDKIGAVGVPGNLWDSQVGTNGTLSTVYEVDSHGQKTVVPGATITISGSRGIWSANKLDYTRNILYGYIDDSPTFTSPLLTVTGIPYEKFRVVVYHSTDTEKARFGYDTINGVDYCSRNTERAESGNFPTVKGQDNWGNAGGDESALELCEGVNYLVSDVISGTDEVTVTAHRLSDPTAFKNGISRSGIAAIQVVEVGVYNEGTTDFEATVTGDATWSSKTGLNVTSGNTWENGLANGITLTTSGETMYTVTFDQDVTAKNLKVVGDGKIAFAVGEGVTVALASSTVDLSEFTGTLCFTADVNLPFAIGAATKVDISPAEDLTISSPFSIPEGAVMTLAPAEDVTLTMGNLLSGDGDIIVAGPGTVAFWRVDANSTVAVTGGTARPMQNRELPGNFIIESGATFDYAGQGNGYEIFTLNGGSLVNTGSDIGTNSRTIGGAVTLTANSTIGGTGNFGLIASGYAHFDLELNGYTLAKTGANTVYLSHADATNTTGTIALQQGVLHTYNSTCDLSALTLTMADGTALVTESDIIVGNLTVTGTTTVGTRLTVNGVLTYQGTVKAVPATLGESATVAVAANAVLNLGAVRTKIDAIGENATIQVEGTDEEALFGKVEIPTTLAAIPETARFTVLDGEAQKEATAELVIGESVNTIKLTFAANVVTEDKSVSDISDMTGRVTIDARDAANGLTFTLDEALPEGITEIVVFGDVTLALSGEETTVPLSRFKPAEGAIIRVSDPIDSDYYANEGTLWFKDVTIANRLAIGGFVVTEGTVVLSNNDNAITSGLTVTNGTATVAVANYSLGGAVTVAEGATLALTTDVAFARLASSQNKTAITLLGTLDLGTTRQGLANGNSIVLGDGAVITGEGRALEGESAPTAIFFTASGTGTSTSTCSISFAPGATTATFDAPIQMSPATSMLKVPANGVNLLFTKPVSGSVDVTNAKGLTVNGGSFEATFTAATNITVNAGSVSAKAASGEKQISGDIFVAAGAKLTIGTQDFLDYGSPLNIHVHGTLSTTARLSISSQHHMYLYQGSSLTSSANHNQGDFEFYQNNTIVVEDGLKPIVIDAYLGVRTAGTKAVFHAENQAVLWVKHTPKGAGHLEADNVLFLMKNGNYDARHVVTQDNAKGGFVEFAANLTPTLNGAGKIEFSVPAASESDMRVQFGTIRSGSATAFQPVADEWMTIAAPRTMKFLSSGLYGEKPGFFIRVR